MLRKHPLRPIMRLRVQLFHLSPQASLTIDTIGLLCALRFKGQVGLSRACIFFPCLCCNRFFLFIDLCFQIVLLKCTQRRPCSLKRGISPNGEAVSLALFLPLTRPLILQESPGRDERLCIGSTGSPSDAWARSLAVYSSVKACLLSHLCILKISVLYSVLQRRH